MEENDIIKRNADFLCTRTIVDVKISADELFRILRKRRTTGVLKIELNGGGIRTIQLDEQSKMTESERDEIRKIMKMI